jgi:WD40 repeat protein
MRSISGLKRMMLIGLGITPLILLVSVEGSAQGSATTQTNPQILTGQRGGVTHVGFSPDGQELISNGDDGTVHFWRADGGVHLHQITGTSTCAPAFSINEGKSLVALQRTTLGIWASGAKVPTRVIRVGRQLGCAAWLAPDRQSVFLVTGDKTMVGHPVIEEWDLLKGVRRRELWPAGGATNGKFVYLIAVDSDPNRLFVLRGNRSPTAMATDVLEEYDLRSGESINSTEEYSIDGVDELPLFPVSFSVQAGGSLIATASRDEANVKVWNKSSMKRVKELEQGDGAKDNASATAVRFSPDGRYLAVASSNGRLVEWDVATWQRRRVFVGARGSLTSISYSPKGDRIAAGSSLGSIFLWQR